MGRRPARLVAAIAAVVGACARHLGVQHHQRARSSSRSASSARATRSTSIFHEDFGSAPATRSRSTPRPGRGLARPRTARTEIAERGLGDLPAPVRIGVGQPRRRARPRFTRGQLQERFGPRAAQPRRAGRSATTSAAPSGAAAIAAPASGSWCVGARRHRIVIAVRRRNRRRGPPAATPARLRPATPAPGRDQGQAGPRPHRPPAPPPGWSPPPPTGPRRYAGAARAHAAERAGPGRPGPVADGVLLVGASSRRRCDRRPRPARRSGRSRSRRRRAALAATMPSTSPRTTASVPSGRATAAAHT